MRRWTIGLTLSTALLAAPPAGAAPARDAALACTVADSAGDRREVVCDVAATGQPQTIRVTVYFLGGHDDTRASLRATWDGRAVDCDEGSKTNLFGEDGAVHLDCRFTMPATSGSRHAFVVPVLFSHAQYDRFTAGIE